MILTTENTENTEVFGCSKTWTTSHLIEWVTRFSVFFFLSGS